jgi:hypothetical protein
LRNPLPERVPLNSDPETLLRQQDNGGSWPALKLNAEFPRKYPPALDTFHADPDLLWMAMDPDRNGRLEWLGDAVVAAAIALSTHKHLVTVDREVQNVLPGLHPMVRPFLTY